MFTGIVRGKGTVDRIIEQPNLRTFFIALPAGTYDGIELGASIAVDGVCLTVTACDGSLVSFDVMAESLRVTNLGALKQGDQVNIERAARDGAEIGGHPLSGHVDCLGTIEGIDRPENNVVMTVVVPQPFIRYIFSKGYISLNGTSLTVTNVDKKAGTFQVWFIPETLKLTTFGIKRAGDVVNVEIDRSTQVMVDTVRDFLEERFSSFLPQLHALIEDK